METRANYALIGALSLLIMGAALAFVAWFSGASKRGGLSTYQIVFSSSVSGLTRGSQVLFNGLKVGEVALIDLLPDNPSEVYALIEINSRIPVKKNTRARLEFQGLTGVASIALSGGTANSEDLVGSKEAPAQIIAERSDFQNILETLQRLSSKTEGVLEHVDQLLGDNSASLAMTMKNVQSFSQALANSADDIQSFITSMNEIGRLAKPLAVSLDHISTSLDARLDAVDPEQLKLLMANSVAFSAKLNTSADKLDQVLGSLNGLLSADGSAGLIGEVGEATKSIRKLADNLDARTKEMSADLSKFTGPGLRQYEALASEGRKTLDELNRALRSMQKNPQQLLFGAKPSVPEYSGR